jgi:hypothetical protein
MAFERFGSEVEPGSASVARTEVEPGSASLARMESNDADVVWADVSAD